MDPELFSLAPPDLSDELLDDEEPPLSPLFSELLSEPFSDEDDDEEEELVLELFAASRLSVR